jgi:hypothetical protein
MHPGPPEYEAGGQVLLTLKFGKYRVVALVVVCRGLLSLRSKLHLNCIKCSLLVLNVFLT